MKKIELELTQEEFDYLGIEMNCLLRSYQSSYAGQRYDNVDMGNVFNKVFKAISGRDHERWIEVNKRV
jgi:hypothetical protein